MSLRKVLPILSAALALYLGSPVVAEPLEVDVQTRIRTVDENKCMDISDVCLSFRPLKSDEPPELYFNLFNSYLTKEGGYTVYYVEAEARFGGLDIFGERPYHRVRARDLSNRICNSSPNNIKPRLVYLVFSESEPKGGGGFKLEFYDPFLDKLNGWKSRSTLFREVTIPLVAPNSFNHYFQMAIPPSCNKSKKVEKSVPKVEKIDLRGK
jgi:hypothetical protein